MSVEKSVVCDGCGMIGDAQNLVSDSRKSLRDVGWRTGLPGGRDLCQDCSEPTNGKQA